MSPLRLASASDARPAAQHPVSILALRPRARTVDHLLQFPAREGLHPPALAAATGGAAAEHPDGELLELRRSDRPRHLFVLHALRLARVDAGHEAGGADGDPASAGRPARSANRSHVGVAARAREARSRGVALLVAK